MIVIQEFPPNIEKIRKVIDPKECAHACFTYGDVIYNPRGGYLDEPLGIHEAQHSLQQEEAGGPERWWNKWLKDKNFRAQQELEAYGLQFRRYCELNRDKNKRAKELHRIASDFSSPQYGSVIGYTDARDHIRAYFKFD